MCMASPSIFTSFHIIANFQALYQSQVIEFMYILQNWVK